MNTKPMEILEELNDDLNFLRVNPFTNSNCDKRLFTYQVINESDQPKFSKSVLKQLEDQLNQTVD